MGGDPARSGITPIGGVRGRKISEEDVIFRAIALEIPGQCGPETRACQCFAREDIPWDSIYYRAVGQILERYIEERQAGVYG
ncbi:hypothetical protein B1218_35870, partial [Pseudomonas ogarae]